MTSLPDPVNYLKHMLESKSTAKQTTYKHLLSAFSALSRESKKIIQELKQKTNTPDKDVSMEFTAVSEHEFHVKLAGDLLIFILHTNVVTFDSEHSVMKEKYMEENEINRYFGQINIYNFMSDSLKFHRVNDPGYLLARIMVNHENRFFVEGEGQLNFLFSRISPGPVTETDLQNMVKLSLTTAIENDLMAPPYGQVKFITLYQKLEHTPELGGGQKIGFRMSYQNKLEG